MLGPNCILVDRLPHGYKVIEREAAAAIQKSLFGEDRQPDWLFWQCGRIADALDRGELALAQIYGLRIQVSDLDEGQLGHVAAVSSLRKAGYDPNEPRVPKGDPRGGQWTNGGNDAAGDEPTYTEVDFSDGFHDEVVAAWVKAFNDSGATAVKVIGLRVTGTTGPVIGYPDILIRVPGLPVEAIEVKTGSAPTFTPNQAWYIPMLQFGNHLYSTDPRITELGLQPGQSLPPMNVYIIHAPGPGQKYQIDNFPALR